jgi:hypothetical protein
MSYKTEITVNEGNIKADEIGFGTLVQNISTREIGYICEIHHNIRFHGEINLKTCPDHSKSVI